MHSIEQQIYASLAIDGLKPGHHTHAATPGLPASAQERHEAICNRWGTYEPGQDFQRALVHLPLWIDGTPPDAPSHYCSALITYQGRDAGGRPGAMLRHIARVPAERYQGLDFHPLHLLRTGKLLESWQPDTPFPVLEPLQDATGADDLKGIFPERYPLMRSLLAHLLSDHRLHIPTAADSPAAEETLAELLELTPLSVRRVLCVATFASRNAPDYHLAAVRQEGASFRKSLEDLSAAPAPTLGPEATAYLDQLFAALDRSDWAGALRCIQTAQVPFQADPRRTPEQGGHIPEPKVEPKKEAPRRQLAEEMPYRRAQPQPKSSKKKWIVGAALVAVVAVTLFFMGRGNEAGVPTDRPNDGVLSRVEAGDLRELVESYRTRLSRLLADGARDFDIGQALRAGANGFPAAVSQAATGAARAEEVEFHRSLREHGWTEPATDVLSELVEKNRVAVGELAAIHAILRDADTEALRANFDASTGTITFPASSPVGSDLRPAVGYAEGLSTAQAALPKVAQATNTRSQDLWSDAATALEEAMAMAPDGLAPTALTQLTSVARAAARLLPWEEKELSASTSLLRYDWGATFDPAQTHIDALLRATDWFDENQVELPATVAAMRDFYRTAQVVRRTVFDAPDPAASLGDAMRATTGCECEAAVYDDQRDRWQLEAWRRTSPNSAAGASVLEAEGAGVRAGLSTPQLTGVVNLLERLQSAPSPAPPDLAGRVSRQREQLPAGAARSILDHWASRNQRGAANEQSQFQSIYADLQSALSAFRNQPGASSYTALRKTANRLAGVDLRQSAGAQADASRTLREALVGPASVGIPRARLALLTQSDYSGTERPVASVRLELRAADQTVWSATFPPMLWGAGIGFDAAEQTGSGAAALEADQTLLVVGIDTKTDVPWFHFHLDPPAEGHVASRLPGDHTVKVRRSVAGSAQGGDFPRSDGSGDEVAKVTFIVQDGWWSDFARSLPTLP